MSSKWLCGRHAIPTPKSESLIATPREYAPVGEHERAVDPALMPAQRYSI